MTQTSMNTLVLRMRKNLAPHLKSLMGAWLLSQCDTYPTVASAAQQAFQTAFPPVKQVDALVFCKQESAEVYNSLQLFPWFELFMFLAIDVLSHLSLCIIKNLCNIHVHVCS